MSENRFANYTNPASVLWTFRDWESSGLTKDVVADALARIRELTPLPAVSEEARERACQVIESALEDVYTRKPGCQSIVAIASTFDRIIDALGYTPAPPEESPECPCPPGDCCVSQTTSPPVVELDADELRGLADALEGLDNYADGLTIGTKDGAWVLRIGGDQ